VQHQVTMTTPAQVLEGLDVRFEIVVDNVKMGTLLVSRGDLAWKPRHSKGGTITCSWGDFIEWIESDDVE
jgi:hypothetical protein